MPELEGPKNNKKKEILTREDMDKLLNLVETTRYGSITLVIQDGKVIQIERNEKIRLV
jgi:hypothetical protein